jgi:hypothetical protein
LTYHKKKEESCTAEGISKCQETIMDAEDEEAPASTQQANRCIIHGKCPALLTRGNQFKKRLCDKQNEMTVEFRDTDNAQPVM